MLVILRACGRRHTRRQHHHRRADPAGQIRPGTPFSPDQIAEKYWSVAQSDGTWHSEFRYDGT
jgi:hypothetical protein